MTFTYNSVEIFSGTNTGLSWRFTLCVCVCLDISYNTPSRVGQAPGASPVASLAATQQGEIRSQC